MNLIVEGYKDIIRGKLGIEDTILSDEDIDILRLIDRVQLEILSKVPEYESITTNNDEFYIQEAAISYMCYLLCPTMNNKVFTEVSATDIRWKKDKIDWDKKKYDFYTDYEDCLSKLEEVEVVGLQTTIDSIIASKIDGNSTPIGE